MWKTHRVLIDHLNLQLPFLKNNKPRVLALSVSDEISHAQLFPYFKNASDLNIQIRELPVNAFLSGENPYCDRVDAILLQTWFDLSDDGMNELLDKINAAWPGTPITYLDWFAPSDLRYAKVLAPRVTSYVKKQILADFGQYGRSTLGDTNLTDYCARRYNLSMPTVRFEVPDDFEKKITLGTGFEYSPKILDQLSRGLNDSRSIDVHARIAITGTDWYAAMRKEARRAVDTLPTSLTVAKNGRVSRRSFFRELRNSKLCFSPFGYGEICWRDFEAMSSGSVLIKPDVAHLKLAHNIFVPGETYVPVKWDLSDLSAKVDSMIASPLDMKRISKNAHDLLKKITRDQEHRAVTQGWGKLSRSPPVWAVLVG
jgi:hypothetical protein